MTSKLVWLGAVMLAIVGLGCGDGNPATDDAGAADGGSADSGGSDAAIRIDSGRDVDGGPDDEDGGPGDADGGAEDLDAGTGEVDSGADVDGGAGDVDSGTGDVDGGSVDVDGGPSPVDGGPVGVDGGPVAVDSGPIDGGDLAPTCTITAPAGPITQDYDDDFVFVASASDPEDGALSGASVVWRSDRVVPPLGSGLSTTELLAPGVHVITCTATDSAGNTGTDTVTVTSRSPVAVINHPSDGETRPRSVPFVGVGRDFEDGALTGASLVWTSNVDGMLGTGTSFTRMLTPGTNVVTLTVTDSAGNTGTDVVTLTITP